MSLPPVLAELVTYFEPLSTLRRDFRGAVTLHTPGVNVFASNATFVPDADLARLPPAAAWHRARGVPALMAAVVPLPGEEVASLRVGTYHPTPEPGVIVVEQVSRLGLPVWATLLTGAHGTPEWAGALSRHLAPRLEGDRHFTLLMAYAGGEPVGALLRRESKGEGAAHLWGTLDPAADAPLLNTAHALGSTLRVSLPSGSPLQVVDEQTVFFTLLEEHASAANEGNCMQRKMGHSPSFAPQPRRSEDEA
ncbi:hypothetical protein [Deinococcus hopiensis]|uniref:Uncharacterized protein n=1 Tax=Deinococcus hopiensis KR-140 TaxID=695939 RepID=A0A1W1VM66_9DEIO|nr:hypothetical protein [Deinococcus hopiensis]SMB94462.1 hypothetical protein SAMN00790413_02393 [Deinococcus hopiensis KR-140]